MQQLLSEKLENLRGNADALLQTLASCQSLVFSPASSEADTLFDALVRFVRHENRSLLLRSALKLLGDMALLHPVLMPSAVAAARPFLGCGKRLAAESLAVLVSLAEAGGEGLFLVRSAMSESFIFSFASSHAVAVRSMLVKLLVLDVRHGGAESLALRQPLLVVGVLLVLTADLYPSVRSAALDGLRTLFSCAVVEIEVSVLQSCYDVATLLLPDVDSSVRISAIRLLSKLGGVLSTSKSVKDGINFSDAHFLLLCSFARDMDMKVRVHVFFALGRVKLVSESILLQSLSKKLLRSGCGGKPLAKCNAEKPVLSLCCTAGVFVHGLEDEFHEVRRAACDSLGIHTRLSSKFADCALIFLMDMLNDDSAVVQLEALQKLTQMAMQGDLNIPESHIHLLIGAISNNNSPIRCAARNVIRLMKFSGLEMFKSSINELLANLDKYPEDEEDVIRCLFCIGKAYDELAVSTMNEYIQEINSFNLRELNLDKPRVAALLVLALSSTFSDMLFSGDMPSSTLVYAISLLARISRALQGLISQDSLLAHLCKLNGLPYSGIEQDFVEIEENESILYEKLVTSASKQTLRTAAETWCMIKAQATHTVLKTLRACEEELEMITLGVSETSKDCLLFTLEYVQVVKLMAEVWEQIPKKDSCADRMKPLDILLEKLEDSLRITRYCFKGLSKEEESHIVELMLLVHALRLLKIGFWADPLVKKMMCMIRHLELIHGETCHPSAFVKELKCFCSQGVKNGTSYNTSISNLLENFTLKQMAFSGKFTHIKAELNVLSDNSELPHPFVPGLPVGIQFSITLYNVPDDARVWLKMGVGQSTRYAFLSLSLFDTSGFERRCIVEVPYFRTPKAALFLLKASVCLECPSEHIAEKGKHHGGPSHDIVLLCKEKDVYLADVGTVMHEL